MRAVSFGWLGVDRKFTPTMSVLSALAADINRASEGSENSLSLASKMNAGGADPIFASTALWHMLKASRAEYSGSELLPETSREEAYEQMMGSEVSLIEKTEFRAAYLQSVLPSVDMGKKLKVPAETLKPKKRTSKK